MVKFILVKSPDEWATTKQACRDELVVYLSFSSIYTTLYFYVLSTVLRKSSFTLYIYIYIYYSLVLHALYNKSMIENLSKKVSELFLLFLNLYHIKVHVIFVCFDFTFTFILSSLFSFEPFDWEYCYSVVYF